MIRINEKEYENILIRISFGEYSITQYGKKRKGKAPFISFECDDVYLCIETVYDSVWLEELNINDKKDISKYISDITYEDEKGWISLITGSYICSINKIDENLFAFEFSCETEECGSYFNITINENIVIE